MWHGMKYDVNLATSECENHIRYYKGGVNRVILTLSTYDFDHNFIILIAKPTYQCISPHYLEYWPLCTPICWNQMYVIAYNGMHKFVSKMHRRWMEQCWFSDHDYKHGVKTNWRPLQGFAVIKYRSQISILHFTTSILRSMIS